MKRFQAIRISDKQGRPTNGDKYITLNVPDDFMPDFHEVYETQNSGKVMILFEME